MNLRQQLESMLEPNEAIKYFAIGTKFLEDPRPWHNQRLVYCLQTVEELESLKEIRGQDCSQTTPVFVWTNKRIIFTTRDHMDRITLNSLPFKPEREITVRFI